MAQAPATPQAVARKRVVIVPHVGVALGHVVRAIALQRALEPGVETLLAIPIAAKPFIERHFPTINCSWIRWSIGHNDAFDVGLSTAIDRSRRTTRSLSRVFEQFGPDLVLGLPGFHTSFACRLLGVRHKAVLHGPWLTPEYSFGRLTADEKHVTRGWLRAIEVSDTYTRIMAYALGYDYKGYRHWLDSEEICIAQDFDVPSRGGRPAIGFLTGDYGSLDNVSLPSACISILFGSALPHVSDTLISVAAQEGIPLIVVGVPNGSEGGHRVTWLRAAATSELARLSRLGITHCGIGTIGPFAAARVPQLFIPHDIDQAINAMLACRSGYGTVIGLSSFEKRTPFGRIAPELEPQALRRRVQHALAHPYCGRLEPVSQAMLRAVVLS